MEYALPSAWGSQDSRGFWTKRKKTAMSMLAVLALIAGIAVAFKLFEQTVPNNVVRDASNFDFVVEVFRAPAGGGTVSWLQAGPPPLEPIFTEFDSAGAPISQFPGDTREQSVRIRNTNSPAKAATFFMYVDPASIVVKNCTISTVDPDTCSAAADVPASNPDHTAFVNFWTLKVDKELVFEVNAGVKAELNENDHSLFTDPVDPADHDRSGFGQTETVCSGGLRQIQKNSPCNMGTAKGAGSEEIISNQPGFQPLDTRWYTFSITEADPGTDQSKFKGWTIRFTMVFQARVPALPDPAPVGER